jgi:hypothetical protein
MIALKELLKRLFHEVLWITTDDGQTPQGYETDDQLAHDFEIDFF